MVYYGCLEAKFFIQTCRFYTRKERERMRETERDRERQRDSERQTDRDTDRVRETERDT